MDLGNETIYVATNDLQNGKGGWIKFQLFFNAPVVQKIER